MRARFLTTRICIVVLLALSPASAQQAAIPPQVLSNLSDLTRNAGYIFSGTVISITRSSTGAASMLVTFRVQQAIRGVSAGQIFTMREWAGLWDAGDRYHPGEQVVLFLYPASHLGLTSPVAGTQGRLSISGSGQITLPPIRSNPPHSPLIPYLRPAGSNAIDAGAFLRAVREVNRK